MRVLDHAVSRFREEVRAGPLHDLVGPDVALVPCPRSAPFPPGQQPALWVPKRICEALRTAGFGASVLPLLQRRTAVHKSAFAAPGQRPSVQEHVESLHVDPGFEGPERVTVVDDVVTKGATLLAAASLVAAAFPVAEVRGFALVRTMGLVPEVEALVDPVVGHVRLTPAGGADRQP